MLKSHWNLIHSVKGRKNLYHEFKLKEMLFYPQWLLLYFMLYAFCLDQIYKYYNHVIILNYQSKIYSLYFIFLYILSSYASLTFSLHDYSAILTSTTILNTTTTVINTTTTTILYYSSPFCHSTILDKSLAQILALTTSESLYYPQNDFNKYRESLKIVCNPNTYIVVII